MSCETSNLVHAYHDGELSIAQRAFVEAHLKECPECRELLAELQTISQLIAATPLSQPSTDVLARLREARYVLPDAGVLRIAGWLTAAAAAILLTALPFLPKQQSDTTIVAGAIWPPAAVSPPDNDSPDDGHSDAISLAQWMADDLSGNSKAGNTP